MLRSVFDEAGLEKQLEDIKKQQQAEDFWLDMSKVKNVGKQQKEVENKLNKIKQLSQLVGDIEFECEYAELEDDESLIASIDQKIISLDSSLEETTLSTLFSSDSLHFRQRTVYYMQVFQ